MVELQDLLFGKKPDEPNLSYEQATRDFRNLEKLASFIETQNEEPELPGQMQQIRVDEVRNTAGGYVFQVDDRTRVRRFLILGTSGGTYYSSEKTLTMENVKDLCEIIQKGKGLMLLQEILEISLAGRAPKQDSTMFALALCARYKVCDTLNKKTEELWPSFKNREFTGCHFNQEAPIQAYLDYQRGLQLAALRAVSKVCRIPTHLFLFLKYCKLVSQKTGIKESSSGWGRALREAVSNWYFNFTPERLALLVTKYQNREGYSHRDMFRLCHITPKLKFSASHNYWKYSKEYDFLFDYIAHGLQESKKRKPDKRALSERGNQKKLKYGDEGMDTSEKDTNMGVGGDVKLVEEHKINEIKVKLQNIFKDNWDEGFSVASKKTIETKIANFVEDMTQEILSIEGSKAEKKAGKRTVKEAKMHHLGESKSENIENTKTYIFINAFEALKRTEDPRMVVEMIKKHGFVREHIPTNLLNSKEVWKFLLEDMPMTAMIRNLGKMSAVGLLDKTEENKCNIKKVISKLEDEQALKDARIHPVSILLAGSVYKAGRGERGKLSWEPVDAIEKALDKAFLLAFKNVTPTNKRYCLALDVSGSMDCLISGTHLSCREAASALSIVLLRTEPLVNVVAFSDGITQLDFTAATSLDQVLEATNDMDFSSTDCAQPMLWACEKKKKFDVFVVYTDNETWFGDVHPFAALKRYRKEMEIPDARLVVMGMTATSFSIADPTDPGMLDICGFDSAVPELLKEFVLGKI